MSPLGLAWRRLVATPVFVIFSVLALALGVGTVSAVFSTLKSAFLTTPSIRNIESVLNLYASDPRVRGAATRFSWPDYLQLRARQTAFGQVAGWSASLTALGVRGSVTLETTEAVTGDYFDLTGTLPLEGRLLQPADDKADSPAVAVVSESFWRQLGGEPHFIGTTVTVDDNPVLVVGIVPASFRGVNTPGLTPTNLWISFATFFRVQGPRGGESLRNAERHWISVKARLRPNTSVENAASEIAAVGAGTTSTSTPSRGVAPSRWTAIPTADEKLGIGVDSAMSVAAGSMVLGMLVVLVGVCANVASFSIARGARRHVDQVVSLALGASRWQTIRGFLLEGGIVAVLGGVLAVPTATFVAHTLSSAATGVVPGAPIHLDATPTFVAVAFGALLELLVVMLCVVWPAWALTRTEIRGTISQEITRTRFIGSRIRRNLIAFQMALSLALLSASVVTTRAVLDLSSRFSSSPLSQLATASIDFSLQHRPETEIAPTVESVLTHAQMLQPDRPVAASSGLPFEAHTSTARIGRSAPPLLDNENAGQKVLLVGTTPRGTSLFGATILRGRSFSAQDSSTAPPVAIITARAAMSVYRSLDVIGMELALVHDGQSLPAVRIVGVAKDFETSSSRKVGPPVVYLPLAQHYEPFITFAAPGTTNPDRAIAALREAVHAGAPSMAIVASGAAMEVLHPESGPLRIVTAMLIILGWVGVILAAGGLYGVVSYLTEQRKQELGIRIALGATRNQILRLVIAGGIRPLIEGLALGLGCAIVVRAIGSQYSVGGAILDPILLISAVPVITAGVLACWIPALRAARREPLVALRCD